MRATLSLEIINTCLTMEQKTHECRKLLLSRESKTFLEATKQTQADRVAEIQKQIAKISNTASEIDTKIAEKTTALQTAKTMMQKFTQATNNIITKEASHDAAQTALTTALTHWADEYRHVKFLGRTLQEKEDALAVALTEKGTERPDPSAPSVWAIAGHKFPSVWFEDSCTWRVSPNRHVDQLCKTKEKNLRAEVEALKSNIEKTEKVANTKWELLKKQEARVTQAKTALDEAKLVKIQLENDYSQNYDSFSRQVTSIEAVLNGLKLDKVAYQNQENAVQSLNMIATMLEDRTKQVHIIQGGDEWPDLEPEGDPFEEVYKPEYRPEL